MTRSRIAVATLSVLFQLPALAADAPAMSPAPVAVKAQAAELARIMVPREEWSRAMELMAKDVQKQMQSHPGSKLTFPADFGAKVRTEVNAVLPYEDLIGMHARELSATYTDKEITDLIAFHNSPLGQKYLKAAPQEGEKVAQQAQKRFAEKMPAVMQKLTAGLQHPDPRKAEAKPAR